MSFLTSFAKRVRNRTRLTYVSAIDLLRDRKMGISTWVPNFAQERKLLGNENRGNEGTGYLALDQIAARVPMGPDDVFVDIGCGYGRVVCHFALQKLKRCDGIELRPELIEQARKNADALKGRQSPIDLKLGDATQQDYGDYTVIFMYNPVGGEVMKRVLDKIGADLRGKPFRLVYANPVELEMFKQIEWLTQTGDMWVPYRGNRMAVTFWQSNWPAA